jgi:aminocarboxymuconate-semialdehyde decarboxylase
MFQTCTPGRHLPGCDHQDANAAPIVKGRRGRSLRIDIHAHYHNLEVGALAAPLKPHEKEPAIVFANPMTREINQRQMQERGDKLSGVEQRIKDMDRMGIDIQAVSVAPAQYYYWAEAGVGLDLSRMQNDRLAEIVASHPDRFVGLGTVPLQDARLATAELVRCVKKLGMRGVQINTNVAGVDLADKRLGLDRFFAKAQELDVVMLMHPLGFDHGERMIDYYFNNVIGNPLESTLAVGHLIFGGVLDRFPDLKFCVAHAGGYLPHYPARMDHAWRARADASTIIKKKPSSYLKKFYFDTLTFDSMMLDQMIDRYGARKVVLGTDYPYDMGDDDPIKLVRSVTRLTPAEQDLIMGGNAARLLKIKATGNQTPGAPVGEARVDVEQSSGKGAKANRSSGKALKADRSLKKSAKRRVASKKKAKATRA